MDVEWEWYRATDETEALTTAQARERFDIEPGHTVVADGVLVLAVNEGEAGFALFGTPAELIAWLDRARRHIDLAGASQQVMC